MTCLQDLVWETRALLRHHPPRFRHPNKEAVYGLVRDTPVEGRIRVQRWANQFPERLGPAPAVEVQEGPFAYDDPPTSETVVFYPNFADYDLFGYWDGPLLAQDELQVLEHPVLGAVREALVAGRHATFTVDGSGRSTPFTLMGVPRQVALDLTPGPGRPDGLYGNRFARVDASAAREAAHVLAPPTCTNLLAMAAPSGGRGPYTDRDIRWILSAAYTAFEAATRVADGRSTVVHTGFWGCGAFGGNRVLMVLAQLEAAGAAGIDRIVFHTLGGTPAPVHAALVHHTALRERVGTDSDAWVAAVQQLGFLWGVSDGQ